jgi:hypothetical protein
MYVYTVYNLLAITRHIQQKEMGETVEVYSYIKVEVKDLSLCLTKNYAMNRYPVLN